MDFTTALASLSREELIALVQQLRQQLTDREQEIARLKSLAAQSTFSAEISALASTEPEPGSQEDLLMQLEKIYPEGE
jgi:signal transduction histidine kinase